MKSHPVELRREIRYYGCIPCDIFIAGDVCHALITNTSLHGIGIIVDERIFDDIEDIQDISIEPFIDLKPCDMQVEYRYMKEINENSIYYYGLRVQSYSKSWLKYIANLKSARANMKQRKFNLMP